MSSDLSRFFVVIGAKTGELTKGLNQATGSLQSFGKSMNKAGKNLTLGLTLPIIGVGVASLKMSADFESAMREVNTMLLLSEGEFQALSADVQQLAKDLGVDATGAAQAMYQAISAGIPKENVIDFLAVASKAAIGGVTDTATAVDGLSTVINAYGMEAEDAEKVADIMFTTVKGGKTTFEELSASMFNVLPMAAAVGWEFEEVAAALAAMTQKGIPTAQATTQLKQVMVSLLKPTSEALEIIEQYGIGLNNETVASQKAKDGFIAQKNELNSLTLAYQKTTEAINGMSAEMDELGDMQAVNSLEIRKLRFEADKDSRELTAKEIARIKELQMANESLGIQYDELSINRDNASEAAEAESLAIDKQTGLVNAAVEAYNSSAKELKSLPEILEQINTAAMTEPEIVKMFGSVEAAGAIMALKGEGHADAYIEQLENMENAQGASNDAFNQMEESVARKFEDMMNQFKDIALTIGTTIIPVIQQLMEAIGPIIEIIGNWIAENPKLALTIAGIAAAVGPLLMILGNVLTVIPAIAGALPLLGAAFTAMLGPVGLIIAGIAAVIAIGVLVVKNWDWIKQKASAVWNGVKGVIGAIGTAIKWYFENMTPVGFIINNWELISKMATKIFGGVIKFFQSIPGKIGAAFSTLANIMLAPFRLYVKGMEAAINWIIRQLNKISIDLPNWLPPPLGGKHFGFDIPEISLPSFAHGGIVTQPTLAMVGEAGPEAIIPLNNAGAAGIIININGNWAIREDADIGKVSRGLGLEVERKLRLQGL